MDNHVLHNSIKTVITYDRIDYCSMDASDGTSVIFWVYGCISCCEVNI